jgi:hypothetical protein
MVKLEIDLFGRLLKLSSICSAGRRFLLKRRAGSSRFASAARFIPRRDTFS